MTYGWNLQQLQHSQNNNNQHHRGRVAGEGLQAITPPRPQPTVRLQLILNYQNRLIIVKYTASKMSAYLIRRKKFFAQAKVRQYNVSIRVKQYVLQLDVAINNAQLKWH